MSRRPALPGADELFRRTDPDRDAADPAAARPESPAAEVHELRPGVDADPVPDGSARASGSAARRRTRPAGDRRPSGRERHEEKITVYVSPTELVDLEQAKLTLRAHHGLAVDRGRIVREAIAVIVADLDANGDASTLVRRLRGT
jgi:hypothetical protein